MDLGVAFNFSATRSGVLLDGPRASGLLAIFVLPTRMNRCLGGEALSYLPFNFHFYSYVWGFRSLKSRNARSSNQFLSTIKKDSTKNNSYLPTSLVIRGS